MNQYEIMREIKKQGLEEEMLKMLLDYHLEKLKSTKNDLAEAKASLRAINKINHEKNEAIHNLSNLTE